MKGYEASVPGARELRHTREPARACPDFGLWTLDYTLWLPLAPCAPVAVVYPIVVDWFTDRHFFLLAVAAYGLSTVYSVFLWRKGFREDNLVNYFLLLLAFGLHTTAMIVRGLRLSHCPVSNLYEVTAFVSWTIVAVYLLEGLWPRLRFLVAFS